MDRLDWSHHRMPNAHLEGALFLHKSFKARMKWKEKRTDRQLYHISYHRVGVEGGRWHGGNPSGPREKDEIKRGKRKGIKEGKWVRRKNLLSPLTHARTDGEVELEEERRRKMKARWWGWERRWDTVRVHKRGGKGGVRVGGITRGVLDVVWVDGKVMASLERRKTAEGSHAAG